MVVKVAPKSSANVRAVTRLWRDLPRELTNDIRKWQRAEINPIWREEVAARPKDGLQSAVFKSGTNVRAGAFIELRAGSSSRKMSGGGTPRALVKQAEFGSDRTAYTKYNRTSRKGKRHTVTRRTSAGLPLYKKGGHVAYPASAKAIKRIASLAVQVTVRRIHDAIDGRG